MPDSNDTSPVKPPGVFVRGKQYAKGAYGPFGVFHDHEADELTIGCPACKALVAADQDRAALRDAPVRRCHWTYYSQEGKRYTFTLDVKVPAGWEPWQVDEEYAGDTGLAISNQHPNVDMFTVVDFESIECTNIGPRIMAQPAEVEASQEALF